MGMYLKIGSLVLEEILMFIFMGIIILLVLRFLIILFFKWETILYHTNGRIHIQGYTLFNKRIGDFKVFDDDGNLINRWYYKNQDKIRDEFINPKSGKVWKVIKNSDPKIIIHLDKADRSDIEFVKQALAIDPSPSNIKYVLSKHNIGESTILSVLKRDGLLLEFIGEERKKDYLMVSYAVRQNGLALQFADKSLKKNKEIVLKALQQNGLALKFADTTLQMDSEIIFTAIEQNGYSLQYAIPTMLEAKPLLKLAIKQIGYPFTWENWFIFFVWANYHKFIREVELSSREKKMIEFIDNSLSEEKLLNFKFGPPYMSNYNSDRWYLTNYYRSLTKMKRLIIKYLNDKSNA